MSPDLEPPWSLAKCTSQGFVAPVRTKDGAQYLGGVSPAQFDEQPIGELRAAPGYGEHNVAVLQELGYSDAEIAAFRDSGVIT